LGLEQMKMETGIITLNKISIIVMLAIMEEAMNIVLHLSFMRKKEFGCIKDGDCITFHIY